MEEEAQNQTQMEQVNQNLEAEWQEILREDFVVTPPVTPQVPPPEAGGNAGSGSRVAGKPESEVKRKESGRRSPEPNTDGAGEPESGSRVAEEILRKTS